MYVGGLGPYTQVLSLLIIVPSSPCIPNGPHETPTGRERAAGLGIQFLQFTYVGTPFGAGEQTQSSDVDFTSKKLQRPA